MTLENRENDGWQYDDSRLYPLPVAIGRKKGPAIKKR